MDFKSLKKSSSLDKLSKALQDTKNKNFGADERYWQPSVDKAGNGFAIIRFLPAPPVDGEDGIPWVKIFTHGFQGPGGWYIENSLTTIGQKDPVSEENSRMWELGGKANQDIARARKRRLQYISNILVVKDADKPECEGKVFLYSYGVRIFDKIQEQIEPSDEQKALAEKEDVVLKKHDIFNMWTGYDFKMRIAKVDGQRSYAKSSFEKIERPIAESDDEIEKIWKNLYSLRAEVAPNKFKSYEELKTKMNKVLGGSSAGAQPKTVGASDAPDDSVPFDPDPPKASVVIPRKPKTVEPKEVKPAPVNEASGSEDGGDDEMLAMFQKLANS